MQQAHVFISGTVQGVGYRMFVRKNAEKLGLTGWVQNLPDGRVEAIFQGSKEKVDEVLKLCKIGPFLAEVRDMEVEGSEAENSLSEFMIR